jgi:fructose-bisphosphate aldolase class II
VGNVHGFYRGKPRIDFKRLEQIHERIGIPLVFHGGTGLGPEIIKEVTRLGVRKINIGTLIKNAFTRGLKYYMDNNLSEIDPRKILKPARESVVEELRGVLRMFGSSNKNWISTNFEEVRE